MKNPLNKTSLLALALCAAATSSFANIALWTGQVNVSATTNWSDPLNWSNIGTGGTGPLQNSVMFSDTTGVGDALTINNVVDDAEHPFSVTYTNLTTFQNTLIAAGQTLRIDTGGLTMGNATSLGSAAAPTTTITGPGAALVVSNGNITVALSYVSSSATPTLDLSAVDTLVATNVSRLLVGQGSARASGRLYLAKTNFINLTGSSPELDVGDNSSNNGSGSSLYLGQTNVIFVDSIGLGLRKQNAGGGGKLAFNLLLGDSYAYIRGSNGVSGVSTWAIADGQAQSGTITDTGSADFTGGTVDAKVNAMWIGRNSTAANAGTAANNGTLTLSAGSFVVGNLTNAMLASSAQNPTVNGTINVNGTATLAVTTNLAMGLMNGFSGNCNSIINVNGGTLLANAIVCGTGPNNALNLSGATLVISNTAGNISSPLTTLSISSSTVELFPVTATAPVAVGTLALGDDANVMNVGSVPTITGYPAYIPLISYTGLGAGGSFSLGTLPSTYSGYISNDNTSTIWLVITNGPSVAVSLAWRGNVNNNWDTTSLNWAGPSGAVNYADADFVSFDDLGQSTTVNLTGPRLPSTLTVNNSSLNYTFTGAGSLGGLFGLVKQGSSSLTLAETGGDNFSGGVQVNGGTVILDDAGASISGGVVVASGATLQVGNNDTNGVVPAGTLQVDGTLVLNRTDNVVIGTAITGAGSFTQNGSGIVTLTTTNGYSGNTTVSRGTLALSGSGSLASSSQVTVNNGTLDLSGIAGVSTLNNLGMAGGALNLNVAYLRPLLNVMGLSASGSANTINIATLPAIGSYPSTLPIVQASGGIGGYNFVLGSLPAATPPYAGSLSLSSDGTTILLTLTSGPSGSRPYVQWSGADTANNNTNWADGQNWQLPGVPAASDYVIFTDAGAAPDSPFSTVGAGPAGVVDPTAFNNILTNSMTIAYLNYSNVLADYQNTLLAGNSTLTVSSTGTNPRLFTVGSAATDFGSSARDFVTIAGTNGTLDLENTNATAYVGLGSGSSGAQATLDLSGLGTFTANVSRLFIGAGGSSVGIALPRESGVVYLARTNLIVAMGAVSGTETSDTSASAAALDVGDNDGNGGSQSSLYLGQTNAIFADAICVSRQKQSAQMLFNPAFTSPAAFFRGQDGTSPVGIWSLADGVVNTGTTTLTGVNDFTGGSLDALVGTMYIGRGANTTSGSGTASGTLSFDHGTLSAGSLYAGYQPASSSKVGIGVVNIGALANLNVSGALNLGLAAGGTGAATTAGTLNINGGVVRAGTIVAGANGGTSTINLNSGTLSVTSTIGTPSAPLTALNLTEGTFQLSLDGTAGTTNVVATSITMSGPVTLNLGAIANASTGVTYPLISYTGTDPFSSLTLTLPAGYAGTLMDDTADSLVGIRFTTVRPPRASITSISVTGTTLSITATNGAFNGRFVLLSSTNVALPFNQWTPVLTNSFDASGHLNLTTNIINPALPQQYFMLSQ